MHRCKSLHHCNDDKILTRAQCDALHKRWTTWAALSGPHCEMQGPASDLHQNSTLPSATSPQCTHRFLWGVTCWVSLPFCSVSSCKHFIHCHGGGEGAPALVALCWYIDQVRPKLWSVAFHANEHHHHHHWWWWGGRWYLFFYILTKWAVKWCPSCKCSLKTPHSLSDKHCLPLPRCNDQLKNKNLGCHFKRKFCVIVYAGKCM